MIPKSRTDALTDGIFAFAMTLLVLDLRLPDGFVPKDAAALYAAIADLDSQFIAYVISFFVLGVRWLSMARARLAGEEVSPRYGRWLMFHLFFITCMPFSTMVAGRFGDLPPAVWLYAANMIAASVTGLMLPVTAGKDVRSGPSRGGLFAAGFLVASALLSVGISFFDPNDAMWAYLLNFAPLIGRIGRLWPESDRD